MYIYITSIEYIFYDRYLYIALVFSFIVVIFSFMMKLVYLVSFLW